MSEWIGELTGSLRKEFGDKPHACTLATVDKNGAPRARTVVCRRIGTDGSLWITSDGRSEKNEQVKAVPQAEVVFWLAGLREQFRLLGSVKLLPGASPEPLRLELWKGLSDATRATFLWPSPGAKRLDADVFPEAVGSDAAAPASFEVLVVRPRRVEQLQLTPHPHRRRRWLLAGNWSASEVNP